jgi:hypothetical protein
MLTMGVSVESGNRFEVGNSSRYLMEKKQYIYKEPINGCT